MNRPPLWRRPASSVEEQVTSGGTRRMFREPLARPRRRGIELSSRTPSGESGTARSRGSVRRRTSLLGTCRGGWVTKPPGPDVERCRPGASPVPVTRRALATHTRKGPSSSCTHGPCTRTCTHAGCPEPGHAMCRHPHRPGGLSAVGIRPVPVDNQGSICGPPGDFRWNRKNVSANPCAPGSPGHRTSPTHSGNGERDSSETRVRTEEQSSAVTW